MPKILPGVPEREISSFLLGSRNGQNFLRSDCIEAASYITLQFIKLIYSKNYGQGFDVLLVSTDKTLLPVLKLTQSTIKQKQKASKIKELCNIDYISGKWTGGYLTNQRKKPSCIIVFNPTQDVLREANRVNVPTISLLSGSHSKWTITKKNKHDYTYVIPNVSTSKLVMHEICDNIIKLTTLFAACRR